MDKNKEEEDKEEKNKNKCDICNKLFQNGNHVQFFEKHFCSNCIKENKLIILTEDEIISAGAIGVFRHTMCLFARRGKQHYQSKKKDEWTTTIEGALAEIAVSKATGKYWSGASSSRHYKARYDSGNAQVRQTSAENGHLLIYEADRDEDMIILVIGQAPTYKMVGQLLVKDGKQPKYWNEGAKCPCWWVPQEDLLPPPEIIE